jgi:hypothetical protein
MTRSPKLSVLTMLQKKGLSTKVRLILGSSEGETLFKSRTCASTHSFFPDISFDSNEMEELY